MSEMNFNDIANVAAEADDMTQEVSFQRELPREGPALLRLRDYVEMGRFESNNPKYKPAMPCMLTFELLHPDHMITIGEDKFPDTLTVRVNYGTSAKSNFRKLFNKMNYSGTKNHFSQMLGDAFLGTIHHNKVDKKTYVNLNKDGEYTIGAPRITDPLSAEIKEVPVPEMHGDSKMFLWENAGMTEEMIRYMWDSIYIDGERDDGTSKNWIQNTIKDNIEWEGSATEAAIVGHIDVAEIANPVSDSVDVPDEVEPPAEEADATDPLAALGL